MRVTKTSRSGTAVSQAARVWGEAALSTRATLRAQGVRGELRALDDIVSGRRGVSVPRGVVNVAHELHAAGVPEAQITAQLQQAVAVMVQGVCAMREQQHGPRSA